MILMRPPSFLHPTHSPNSPIGLVPAEREEEQEQEVPPRCTTSTNLWIHLWPQTHPCCSLKLPTSSTAAFLNPASSVVSHVYCDPTCSSDLRTVFRSFNCRSHYPSPRLSELRDQSSVLSILLHRGSSRGTRVCGVWSMGAITPFISNSNRGRSEPRLRGLSSQHIISLACAPEARSGL